MLALSKTKSIWIDEWLIKYTLMRSVLAMDLNSETGSSFWLTVLPLQDRSFHLYKQEFWDALHLRYGWQLPNTPGHCICGSHLLQTSVDMVASLFFITLTWLSKVCYDVAIEPPLQQLNGEDIVPAAANRLDEACVDIHARGFWR